MANYICEEVSSCLNYQSAICLHCNRRLCLPHITEHSTIVFRDVENLSNELDKASQHIKDDCEKRKLKSSHALASLKEWRTKQVGLIEQIYVNQRQCILSQQDNAEHIREQLLQKLEHDAREQIRLIQMRQNASMAVMNHVRDTIKNVRKESENLNCVFPVPPTISIEQHGSSKQSTTTNDRPLSTNPSSTERMTFPKKSLVNVQNFKRCRPLARLIDMFASISDIEQTKRNIDTYIRNQGRQFKLAMLVCCYLTAWHRTSNIDEKVYLLNEHISTIQEYFSIRTTDFDILIGIQSFFHNVKLFERKHQTNVTFKVKKNMQSPANEMMSFLLQFFLNHQCIDDNLILDWYNNRGVITFHGFDLTKELAQSFVESISIKKTDNHVYTATTDPISTEQRFNMRIKDEPMVSN